MHTPLLRIQRTVLARLFSVSQGTQRWNNDYSLLCLTRKTLVRSRDFLLEFFIVFYPASVMKRIHGKGRQGISLN